MAVIKINTFGGELPSVSSRALPAQAARTSRNLLATSNEFRPLMGQQLFSTTVVNNPKTIRRFFRASPGAGGADLVDLTASWAASAEFLSLARGQLDDDETERTFYTAEAGGALVFDNTGFSKLLGVPAPTVPTLVHGVVNEYSVDEDRKARVRIPQEMLDAVVSAGSEIRIGDAPTPAVGVSTAGWLSHEDAVAAGLTVTKRAGDWAYMAPMSGGKLTLPETTYLLATEFGGSQVTYQTRTYWAICVGVQGIGYSINSATLLASFKAITTPDPDVVRTVGASYDTIHQQFTNAECQGSVDTVVAEYAQTNPKLVPSLRQLAVARDDVNLALTNFANQTVLAATVTAFYSKSDVAAEITAAIGNFAASVVDAESGTITNPWSIPPL